MDGSTRRSLVVLLTLLVCLAPALNAAPLTATLLAAGTVGTASEHGDCDCCAKCTIGRAACPLNCVGGPTLLAARGPSEAAAPSVRAFARPTPSLPLADHPPSPDPPPPKSACLR